MVHPSLVRSPKRKVNASPISDRFFKLYLAFRKFMIGYWFLKLYGVCFICHRNLLAGGWSFPCSLLSQFLHFCLYLKRGSALPCINLSWLLWYFLSSNWYSWLHACANFIWGTVWNFSKHRVAAPKICMLFWKFRKDGDRDAGGASHCFKDAEDDWVSFKSG